ncbi:septation protein IspZ [Novosphingobium sp. G106]|uniref:inner membrane-spanning protein YciB n=1 Tax=Novosphingobium sp. G106 TaxID=2849500 RepID=UPI001C2D3592|nr:septation protein IspZ [Novosphingobium sp. G106]MBV1689210.1 septation protein IspZ [Novosphingobium sp. G106]
MIQHLVRAISPLVVDALGMIVFAVLLALHVDVVVAAIIGAVLACSVAAWEFARHRTIAPLQALSVVIVLVSAGATVFTGDPRFVMVKPTIVYAAIGAAMLRKGWMNRYASPEALARIGDLMIRFGYVWAGLMLATALANLIVALEFTAWWPLFIGVFTTVSKLTLFAIQFTATYWIAQVRKRRGVFAA